jgi:wyosine [tRNA(Phe)-imidazoG37] synthetase (radical SAM superfamily)
MAMSVTRLKLFTQHSRSWQNNRYVYPVISRRSRGLSIGVNLNPDKACNFDCIYCSVDRTTPDAVRKVDLNQLRQELYDLLSHAVSGRLFEQEPLDGTPAELRRLNDIAFSGDGEPTSYAKFGRACQIAARLLEKHNRHDVKLVVITNATLLRRPAVATALKFLDDQNGEVWAKLDAGTEQYFRLVERTSIPLSRVLDNILSAGKVRPIVIQSLFMNVKNQPPRELEIAAYVDRLKTLVARGCQIKLVQVYTVAREPAEGYVTPLEDTRLDAIAARLRQQGLPVETFYSGI